MKKGVTFMIEEVRRLSVVEAAINGKMTCREGAAAWHLRQQFKRIKVSKEEGPEGSVTATGADPPEAIPR